MQWDDSPNAGFSTGVPWLPVNPNHAAINAKAIDELRRYLALAPSASDAATVRQRIEQLGGQR